jgi:peptidoglycan hydrolase CwlO-like protein
MVQLTMEQLEKKKQIQNKVEHLRNVVYLYNLKIKQQQLKLQELVSNNAILLDDMKELEESIQQSIIYIEENWGTINA